MIFSANWGIRFAGFQSSGHVDVRCPLGRSRDAKFWCRCGKPDLKQYLETCCTLDSLILVLGIICILYISIYIVILMGSIPRTRVVSYGILDDASLQLSKSSFIFTLCLLLLLWKCISSIVFHSYVRCLHSVALPFWRPRVTVWGFRIHIHHFEVSPFCYALACRLSLTSLYKIC